MADKKVSELDAIAGSATAADDLFLIVDSSGSVTKKITRAELNNAIEQDVLSTVDINGGTIDSTVIGGTTPAAGDFTTLGATGNITVGGTVDGRDVAADGTKLDGIASSATANPNAIDNVVEDTSPQLGGALDVNGNSITSASNGDITIDPNGTGDIVLDANVQIGTTTEGISDYGDTLTLADSDHCGMTIRSGTSSEGNVYFSDGTSGDAEYKGIVKYDHSSNAMSFWSNSLRRVTIDSSGNLLVGKTALGTANDGLQVKPAGELTVTRDGNHSLILNRKSSDGNIALFQKDGTTIGSIKAGNGDLLIGTGDVNLRFFDATPAVIPRTASDGTSNTVVDLGNVSNSFKDLYSQRVKGAAGHTGEVHFTGSHDIRFVTNGNERGRFNSAGALLIGKTSDSISNNGISAAGSATGGGHLSVTNDGNSCVTLNRKSSDGTIMSFATDGSTGGSIGVLSDRLCVGQSDVGLFFDATNNTITPFSFDTFDTIDNHIDLGIGSRRFQDIFASNGTIQTSDENEKQNIASLTSTEITAAKAISALFKTYKWKDAAASKGDAARTHTGVIAQEVQTVMSDAGLDAANYAFWCSDTWWETSTDVPAVEAVEAADAVYDDDGNEVSAAIMPVEAKDAYTRIDTYHTADEAPEGATQRTRMGIRYPELLAFIGAATEQRLTDIETRLTALEAN